MQDSRDSPTMLKSIIQNNEDALGQKIKVHKFSIYFSNLIKERRKSEVEHDLGMKISQGERKYLGLPYLIGG